MGKLGKTIPKHIYLICAEHGTFGSYLKKPLGYPNVKKFKLVEVENNEEIKDKK